MLVLEIASDLKEKFKKEKIGKKLRMKKEIFDFLGEQISKILNPYEKKLNNLYKKLTFNYSCSRCEWGWKTTTIGKLGKLL